jgi:hypothetical protein
LISKKHNFAFLHLPKCGGTSLLRAFKKSWDDPRFKNGHPHLTTDDHNYILRRSSKIILNLEISRFKLFTMVRNPYSRVVSAFFYLANNRLRFRDDRKIRDRFNLKDLDFKEFVKKSLLSVDYMHFNEIIDNYIQYEDLKKIDYIGKVENMVEDFNNICRLIDQPNIKLLHVNKSKHLDYTQYYDEESKNIVTKKYAKDIEYFGYKFGE